MLRFRYSPARRFRKFLTFFLSFPARWPVRYSLAVIIPYNNGRQKAIVNIDKKTIFFAAVICAIFYTI